MAAYDHRGCWFRAGEDRKVINAARALLALATKDALGPMAATMDPDDELDTAADVLWGRLHALDHAIRDRDAAIENDGEHRAAKGGYATDARAAESTLVERLAALAVIERRDGHNVTAAVLIDIADRIERAVIARGGCHTNCSKKPYGHTEECAFGQVIGTYAMSEDKE